MTERRQQCNVCSDAKTIIITSVEVVCNQDCNAYTNRAAIKKIINCNNSSQCNKCRFQQAPTV
jgi:hypothetical protein